MNQEIAIIDYGAGNVQSVKYALDRLRAPSVVTWDLDRIRDAWKVIFPGVGAAGAAMKALRSKGLDRLIPSLTQPTLGICLGMQLMCSSSAENETPCLGIFPERIIRFDHEEKVPHMGWNALIDTKGQLFSGLNGDSHVYFVHSYYLPESTYSAADCEYGGRFCAAVQKDNFYACQFHPEKSGTTGARILENFLSL